MRIADHFTCPLGNLYAGQEATDLDMVQLTGSWKRRRQGYILSFCLFNLYAEYIILNTRLDESQAGIKIARRHMNKLRYADDTTLMAESKEELLIKSLLMRVKEESEEAGLKLMA